MSQLIQMRQRIQSIETIKKITRAMRLISRSFHTKLDRRRAPLQQYRDLLCQIFNQLRSYHPQWAPERFFPPVTTPERNLIIIVGAQKGLCGSFNNALFYWIDTHRPRLTSSASTVISVGKKVHDHLKKRAIPIMFTCSEIKTSSLDSITELLLAHFFTGEQLYTNVTIISNASKTFFTHELRTTQLIPFIGCASPQQQENNNNYVWEHDPEIVLSTLAHDSLRTAIRTALFNSLHAEQSARFLSMDNATRNANTFLESMRLQYNKARQAKITKELAELAIFGSDANS